MLKIGVSPCLIYPDANRAVFSPKTLNYVENDMMRYVVSQGVLPVLIPALSMQELEGILSEIDGLLLQGGTDLAPESYGEVPIADGRWPGDPIRDGYELALLDWAVKHQKPVLGICRGIQLINTYCGGTLYQDTITQSPDTQIHRDAEMYDSHFHEIAFSEGSLLAKIYPGNHKKYVNSIHHQSIKKLGKRLMVEATCPQDGVIEGVVSKDGLLIGVQWHPEFSHTLKEKVLDPAPLFHHFIHQLSTRKK